jgi:transposase
MNRGGCGLFGDPGAFAMDACLYSSDLNDAEWALLAPLVRRSHPAGRRQIYPVRRIVDAIFYLLRTGAQWRLLPHEYPPRGAVFTTMPTGARMAPGST